MLSPTLVSMVFPSRSAILALAALSPFGLAACADRGGVPATTVNDIAPARVVSGAPGTPGVPLAIAPIAPSPALSQATVPPRPAPTIRGGEAPPPPPSTPPVISDPNGITLNFVDAETPSVIAAVLGQTLGVGYAVDPRVGGRMTLQTAAPIPRSAVLPTLENVLRVNGVALVRNAGVLQAVPAEEARFGLSSVTGGQDRGPGWRTQIIPLRHASAANIQRALEGMAAPGTVVRAEPDSNTLIVSGSGSEITGLLDAVSLFDVDGMRGQAVGLFRLQRAVPAQLIEELDMVTQMNPREAPRDVRLVPLERLNAVLAVARQPDTLRRLGEWIERLDRPSDGNDAQLYVYKVENGRAAYLAEMLAKLYPEHAVERAGRERGNGQDRSGGLADDGSGGGNGLGNGGAQTGTGTPDAASGLGGPTSGPGGTAGSGSASGGVAGAAPTGGPASGGAGTRPDTLSGPAADQRLSTGPQNRQQGGSGVRIVADTTTNSLLILARPAVFQQIEQTLRKLDVVPAQVMIEATIAEVRLNDQLRFGVQYFIESGNNAFRFSNALNGSVTPGAPGFSYLFTGGRAQVVVDALKAITDVNVLSTPTVMVLDNQTARLQVGDQVPIVTQQAQSTINTDAPVINQIQLKDTGVILAVTPRITASGTVLMDVWQEVSDVRRTTTSNIDSPSFQRRRLESSVAVANQETIALGGLVRQNRGRDDSGVPVLSEIPVLGALFGVRGDSIDRTELLVLITPRIVRSTQDARTVTDELRRRLSERPLAKPAVLP